ncbi:MAG: acyl carrier protein [Gemmataceae bacterium]|nr:acyl carrier protein [Gemmataceae bacterium]
MTDRAEIRRTLIEFLESETTADTSAVTEDTDLRTGLALDSVDFVGVIMRIEAHYRIRLVHQELEPVKTVADLLNLISAKISPAAQAA